MQSLRMPVAALAALLLASFPAPRAAAETVTFHFAPPDGTNYVQTLITVREKHLEGVTDQTDRSEAKTAVSIKRSGDEYLIAATPLSNTMTRDGKAVQDPISALLHGLSITHVIDANGQVKEIRGYETLAERMSKGLPPEIVKALAPLLNEKTMVARETAEWNGRIGEFAGKTITIGEPTDTEVPFRLPSGESLKYYMRTTVRGLEPCPAGMCARIEMTYNSDASQLGKAVGKTIVNLAAAAGKDLPDTKVTQSDVSGSASRLIDPKTMLLYGEKLARSVTMQMTVPGKGKVPTRMSETREYSFDYR